MQAGERSVASLHAGPGTRLSRSILRTRHTSRPVCLKGPGAENASRRKRLLQEKPFHPATSKTASCRTPHALENPPSRSPLQPETGIPAGRTADPALYTQGGNDNPAAGKRFDRRRLPLPHPFIRTGPENVPDISFFPPSFHGLPGICPGLPGIRADGFPGCSGEEACKDTGIFQPAGQPLFTN